MADDVVLEDTAKPCLPRGVRLRHDEVRGQWILLAPERILKLDQVALEILRRCDGVRTIAAIVDDLATTFAADRAQIDGDVRDFIRGLVDKRMLDL